MKCGWRVLFKIFWVMVSVVKMSSLTAVMYLWAWMESLSSLQHCSISVRFCGRHYIPLWAYIQWNVNVYQRNARLYERLMNSCALSHRILLVRAISPRFLSLRHLQAVRMQSVYMCALALHIETSNFRPCFKAGVCVVTVFYRFFPHNVWVIHLR